MITMTESANDMRFPIESMQRAARRLAAPGETITEVWHRGVGVTPPGPIENLYITSEATDGFSVAWDIVTGATNILCSLRPVGLPNHVGDDYIMGGGSFGVDYDGLPEGTTFIVTVTASNVGGTTTDVTTATTL